MQLSGILVRVTPGRLDGARSALAALPGVDVFQGDPATGRLVVTQEAPSVGSQAAGLERIRSVPGVICAELVYHRFDDDPSLTPSEER
jgi:nitrate reductase NapD